MEEWQYDQRKSETVRWEVQRSEKTEEAWDYMSEKELNHLSEEGLECAVEEDWQLRPVATEVRFAGLIN